MRTTRPARRRIRDLTGLALVASALIVSACSAGASTPTSTGTGGAGGGATTGSGMGGDIFSNGGSGAGTPACDDPTDSDGDGIADALEPGDTDGDGTPDAKSLDSDGDGYPDALEAAPQGQTRSDPCAPLVGTDADDAPDMTDLDTDGDGVADATEKTFDPDGTLGCWRNPDCDGDGVIDLVEIAAKSDPTDPADIPEDAGLYFVLPFKEGEKTKDFVFSAGVSKADIYFLIDTTKSMQPAIDALKSSLDSKIIPAILNGDPNANPPIPAIADAWIGVGTVRDVPWSGYGQPGDDIYKNRFDVGGQLKVGDVAPPVLVGGAYKAPDDVKSILATMIAGGGGDGPEATSQALWIASTSLSYTATIGGLWSPAEPYPSICAQPGMFGVPCFRPDSVPVYVVVTDAPMHNGPIAQYDYDSEKVGQLPSYADAVAAVSGIHAKVVGVPIAGGNPGAARNDLKDLCAKTGSVFQKPEFGGVTHPLVPDTDVTSGEVSDQVVRMLGLLAGAGLNDVTTSKSDYSCPGAADCDGDGALDDAYTNPIVPPDTKPFDGSDLITWIEPLDSQAIPLPYGSHDTSTFYGVRGDASITFRVHAKNDAINPTSVQVLQALIRVQTPTGQVLGGKKGIKRVYFVIPESVAH